MSVTGRARHFGESPLQEYSLIESVCGANLNALNSLQDKQPNKKKVKKNKNKPKCKKDRTKLYYWGSLLAAPKGLAGLSASWG